MRTILIFLSLVIIAIISIPLYGVVWILGKINPMLMHRFSQRIVKIVFRFWLFLAGTRYTVIGREKVPTLVYLQSRCPAVNTIWI